MPTLKIMKPLLITSLLLASFGLLQGQYVYHEWNFDDPAGTLLENTANTGDPGTASWGEGLTHTTNGNGQYVIGNGDSSLGYKSANLGAYAGTLTYVMEIAGWNLDDLTNFRNIALQFRDSVNGSNVINFQINQQASGNVRFRADDNNGVSQTVLPDYAELPSVNPAPYTIAIELNTSTGDWSIRINDGPVQLSGTAIVGDLDVIRFIASNNSFGTGDDFVSIERIALTSTEPAPAATTWNGYDILEDNWVDAVDWLGWLKIEQDPWIYSQTFSKYLYMPEGQDVASGAWIYIMD